MDTAIAIHVVNIYHRVARKLVNVGEDYGCPRAASFAVKHWWILIIPELITAPLAEDINLINLDINSPSKRIIQSD